MAAKAVVRDVARVFGQSYGFADSIAKLIPFELGITLKDALEKEPELQRRYKNEEETRTILDMAMSLEGLVRNAGMHAGGVVIAPSVLTDFAPLFCDETGHSVVTQFDKDDVEAAGLVKFDFLGLRTLTIIDWAVKIINAQRAAQGRAAARHQRAADGRRADVRAAEALRDHRGVPAGIARHEGPDPPPAARLLRGHRRARGAVPAGPAAVGHGRRLHRAQARQDDRADRLPASRPEAGARADLRRDPVPGTGDADRAGAGRLHARRRRPAAPRDGQEEARGDGEAALHLRRRARPRAASSSARPSTSST